MSVTVRKNVSVLGFSHSPVNFRAYSRAYPRLLLLTPTPMRLSASIRAYSHLLLLMLMHKY